MNKRPVLILGARSDIGMALAHRFAKEGWPIQLAGRQLSSLEANRNDLQLRYNVPVSLYEFDVLQLEHIEGFFNKLNDLPEIVISVVGLLGDQAETEGHPKKSQLIVNTNLTGVSLAMEIACEHLANMNEETAIIGISSVAGERGRAKNYWYGASKAGFTAVLSGLRQKYKTTKLHVMTVKPGFVATRMTEGMDLPKPLTSSPERLADLIFHAYKKRLHIVYDWKWKFIMTILKLLPESIFKKIDL